MPPLVSVIIPAYNAEKTIEPVLNSVINQSFSNLEIIVVNDGSTDHTAEIIEKVSQQNKNQIIQIKQPNSGVSAARNTGMRKASGKYIALLDSDDIWKKEKIATQVDIMENHPNIAVVATNKDDNNFESFLSHTFEELTQITFRLMLYKNFLLTSTSLFKREIVDSIGFFDETMRYSEDLDFFCRAAAKHVCFLYNKNMVNAWGNKPAYGHSGLSANLWAMEKGEIRCFRKLYHSKNVNFIQFVYFSSWSLLKHCRRFLKTLTST